MCPPSRLPLRDDLVCIQVVVWARHPKTQECCEYGDPCLAPAGWQTFFTEDECKGPSVCPAPRPEAENEICLTVNAWARDPVTQACCGYPTPCHAPRGWPQFGNEAECQTAPVSCDPHSVPPGSPKTDCPAGQVPRVLGDVFGACVFIESCACSGPEECPQPDQYTCGASGHCERID